MNYNGSTDGRPIVEPTGMIGSDVGASVTDGGTKAAVPVCAMDGVASVIVHGVGHVGDIVASTAHTLWMLLAINAVHPRVSGRSRLASGHNNGINRFAPFPGNKPLGRKVNFQPLSLPLAQLTHAPNCVGEHPTYALSGAES